MMDSIGRVCLLANLEQNNEACALRIKAQAAPMFVNTHDSAHESFKLG